MEIVGIAIAAAVSLLGIVLVWRDGRARQRRRGEIVPWANEVIDALERLFIVCVRGPRVLSVRQQEEVIGELIFRTAVLAERGRLFFKNRPGRGPEQETIAAYRGQLPDILDPIMVAHQVASEWGDADHETRVRLAVLAEQSVKRFVSMAQKEVGRARVAAAETGRHGGPRDVRHLVPQVSETDFQRMGQIIAEPGAASALT